MKMRTRTAAARAMASLWMCSLAMTSGEGVAEKTSGKPNIVMIVVDDLGWADLGFRNENQIETPHFDALWERGVELKRYYVHTVCSPSRAALMTGRYSHHTGVHNWLTPASNVGVELDEVLLSDRLQDAGYATYMVGKWHLGHHTWDHLPTFRGFDYYYGFLTGGGEYFMGLANVDRVWFHYQEATAPRCKADSCARVAWEAQLRYSTELFTEKAVEAIRRHVEAMSQKPLFLLVTYQGVHAGGMQPNQVPEWYVEPYRKTMPPGRRRQFAGMVAAVDSGIGNITAALRVNGLDDDNTLIVVTSDNGGAITTNDSCGSRNTPYRGGKHSLFEGGVRGTAFLAGYGLGRKGRSYEGLMHIVDWYATLADVAGYSLEGGRPLDGVSHWAQLSGLADDDSAASPRRTVVLGNVSDTGRGFGMIVDDDEGRQWKIITETPGFPDSWSQLDDYASGGPETSGLGGKGKPCENGYCLFELSSDPQERHDLALDEAYADKLRELKAQIHEELATYRDIERDCWHEPVPKFEEHVGHAWWPYCPASSPEAQQA